MPLFAVGVTGGVESGGCVSIIDNLSFIDTNDERYETN